MKKLFTLILLMLITVGYSQSESNSKSIDGVYTFSLIDDYQYFTMKTTVTGSRWRSVSKACQYCDNTYSRGLVKGTVIYDESGYIDIGYVEGNNLVTSFAGREIYLEKEE